MQSVLLPPVSASLVPDSTRPVWHQWGGGVKKSTSSTTARRRLFQQEDADEQETNQQFVQRLLAELAERYKQKWGFDFDAGRPLADGDADACCYAYEAVPAASVPGFYRAAHYATGGHNADQSESPLNNSSDAENHHHEACVIGEEENDDAWLQMDTTHEEENHIGIGCSPARALRKARRSVQTPKRHRHNVLTRASDDAGCAAATQTRMTDFLPARKQLSTTSACGKDADACMPEEVGGTPKKRACRAGGGALSPKKTISRERRRASVAVAALFKH